LKVVNALKLYRLSGGAKRENNLSNFDEWTMFWRVITGIEHNQQIPDECLQTLEFFRFTAQGFLSSVSNCLVFKFSILSLFQIRASGRKRISQVL
jgi:hypothetical protein